MSCGKLQDKVAIITGSSKGLGLGIAKAFHEEGAIVVISCRNEAEGTAVAKEFGSDEGRALFVKADVSNLDAFRNVIDETIKTFGKLDILVNNAGRALTATLENTSEEDYDAIMSLNLKSMVFGTKYALPYLRQTKGNIINMCTAGMLNAMPNQMVYNISKGGVQAFTRSLASELAPEGLRVNALAPGVIETPQMHEWLNSLGSEEEAAAMIAQLIPLAKFGTAADVAKAAVYLADNEYITGTTMVIDGGVVK